MASEEQTMIREMARDFARNVLALNAAAWDRDHAFPADALAEMGKLGFMGMTVPPEWDGAGTDYVSYAMAVMEIAAGCGAVSTIMSVHNGVGCMPILDFGNDDQRERFLRPMARGRCWTSNSPMFWVTCSRSPST